MAMLPHRVISEISTAETKLDFVKTSSAYRLNTTIQGTEQKRILSTRGTEERQIMEETSEKSVNKYKWKVREMDFAMQHTFTMHIENFYRSLLEGSLRRRLWNLFQLSVAASFRTNQSCCVI